MRFFFKINNLKTECFLKEYIKTLQATGMFYSTQNMQSIKEIINSDSLEFTVIILCMYLMRKQILVLKKKIEK